MLYNLYSIYNGMNCNNCLINGYIKHEKCNHLDINTLTRYKISFMFLRYYL